MGVGAGRCVDLGIGRCSSEKLSGFSWKVRLSGKGGREWEVHLSAHLREGSHI